MYKNAETATLEALKMQAIGITVTLHSFLQASDIEKIKKQESTIFSEILLDERWEGIAFVALYSMDGTIILHSNPALMGKKIEKITATFNNNAPYYHFVTLGTGERVFVSDSKMIIHKKPYILRVALHTYPAEAVLRTAKMHVMFMIGSAILIISGGLFSIMLLSKVEKMQDKIRELENLSMLSRVLAHEIRNPLGSIELFANMISEDIKESIHGDYARRISSSVRMLRNTLENMLSFTRGMTVKKTPVCINELVEEITEEFKELFSSAAIATEIKMNNKLVLPLDFSLIRQALINLIVNAYQAMPEGGRITINSSICDKCVKLTVKDTGQGIDEEIIERIFDPFFSTKDRGTGLGLSITNSIISAHGGRIEVKSKTGEGTEFAVYLPLE